jgi:hypothetical protein
MVGTAWADKVWRPSQIARATVDDFETRSISSSLEFQLVNYEPHEPFKYWGPL